MNQIGIVTDPAEYPWPGYRFNALGQVDNLVTLHIEFHHLGTDDNKRQAAYRALFDQAIAETQIHEIRDATNKAWVLGDSRFKERIQLQPTTTLVHLRRETQWLDL